MSKKEVAFLDSRPFSIQSELFESFLNCFDWLDKSWPSKKGLYFFYGHVNRLKV